MKIIGTIKTEVNINILDCIEAIEKDLGLKDIDEENGKLFSWVDVGHHTQEYQKIFEPHSDNRIELYYAIKKIKSWYGDSNVNKT